MAKEVYIKTYQTTKSNTSSLVFDGINDFVSIAHNAVFNLTSIFTIEAWVNPIAYGAYNTIISKMSTTEASRTFSIRLNDVTGIVQFIGYDTGVQVVNSTNNAPINTWTHVAVVHNAGSIFIYINGVLSGSGSCGTTATNTSPLTIGTNSTYDYFKGEMQDVRLWSIVRTQQEIANNAFVQLAGNESDLVAYYKLGEGIGTTAIDSKAGLNGTLTNFLANPWQTTSTLIAPLYTRTFKGFSADYSFDSITSQINSGYGSLDFTIPREFDVLQNQDPQNLSGYELDVIAYDNQQTTGITLFSGEVSVINREMSGSQESVGYTATSQLERIAKIDLEDTDSVVNYSAVEIADIFKDIIHKCNAKAGKQILKYTSSSITTTGTTLTITFKNSSVNDALRKVWQSTPSGWIWYIDTDRTVYLKQISSTPNHYFFNTKDISSVKRTTDKTKVVNVLKFWDGLATPTVLRKYTNQTSIDTYGYSAETEQDGRYTTTAGADLLGTKFITDNKNPNDQINLTAIDSNGGGYDIDRIKVGDTFKMLNFKTEISLPSLLVVTSKTDYLDYCEIVASDKETYVSRELQKLKDDQSQVNNSDHPTTAYTNVSV